MIGRRVTYLALAIIVGASVVGTGYFAFFSSTAQQTQAFSTQPETPKEQPTQQSSPAATIIPSYLFFVVAVLAIATTVSVSTSLYLYRWRKIIIEQHRMFVPEELLALMRQLLSYLHDLDRKSEKSIGDLDTISKSTHALQEALSLRDNEIARLRQGYDSELFRRFVLRFLRTRAAVDDFLQQDNPSADLIQVSRLLDDALDECGVERFRPEEGEDFRLAKGVADNPRVIESSTPEDDFRIVKVIKDGYRFASAHNKKPLIPAHVVISLTRKDHQGSL